MKHEVFLYFWLALLAFISTVVGILAYVGYPGAEVIFWTNDPIETPAGKLIWIILSAIAFLIFTALAVRASRKLKNTRT